MEYLDSKLLIDLIFNRETMAIPSIATLHMMSLHSGISQHNILDGSCKDMPVVGESGGERWSIEKDKRGAILGYLETLLEGINFTPKGKDFFFLCWETKSIYSASEYHANLSFWYHLRCPWIPYLQGRGKIFCAI